MSWAGKYLDLRFIFISTQTLIRLSGFKKVANRATTQVMMKTGRFQVPEPGLGLVVGLRKGQGTLRRRTIETTRLKKGKLHLDMCVCGLQTFLGLLQYNIHITTVLEFPFDSACLTMRNECLITLFFRRYRTMESAANRLQKEARGYLDSLRGISSTRAFPSIAQDRSVSPLTITGYKP